jgi:hypothetical protein
LVASLLGIAVWASNLAGATTGLAQSAPSIGVDADPAGNSATSLKSIDSCVAVSKGDTFQVDVFIEDVTDLSAWEVLFHYDPSVVKLTDRDVKMFLAASPGSDVFDPSETLPDGGGLYRLAAVDLAIPHSPDSGSGVLARLTLQAVASGVSPAEIARIDQDGNGTIDAGPLLTNASGKPIPPTDPSGVFFAGPIANAVIAVDTTCEAVTPVPPPTSFATPPPAESPTPEGSAEPPPTSSRTVTPGASPTTAPGATHTPTPATTATATPVAPATTTPTPAVNAKDDDGGSPWIIVLVAVGVVGALAVGTGAVFFVRARRSSSS